MTDDAARWTFVNLKGKRFEGLSMLQAQKRFRRCGGQIRCRATMGGEDLLIAWGTGATEERMRPTPQMRAKGRTE